MTVVPRALTAMPAAKSRYAFPRASYSRQPSPLTKTRLSGRAYVCRMYLQEQTW